VLEQKRAQTRHSLNTEKKRIKSWSMELQMLQILQLAVWDLSSAQNQALRLEEG